MQKLELYAILVREHQTMLSAYLRGLVRDPEFADELAQETFVRAYLKLSELRQQDRFGAWLRAIARNLAVEASRRRAREVPTDPEILKGMEEVFARLDEPTGDDSWEDRAGALRLCFDSLPDKLRQSCRLHYFEDRPAREIAERLGLSLAAVLKHLERSRAALRQCVERRLGLMGVDHG